MVTIAWDIDDVINNLMREWFEKKWLVDHEDCPLSYNGLLENPPNKILGISLNKYLNSLDQFRHSKEYMMMKPMVQVEQWFHSYAASSAYCCSNSTATAIHCTLVNGIRTHVT